MTPTDAELLQHYVREASHSAFTQLVARHLDLVYSVARRHLGSTTFAEDVAQSVFLDLARNAARIKPDTPLVAWLHLVARRTAIDTIRRDSRRRALEQQAAALAPAMHSSPPSPDWPAIEPLLDEAVESLPPADRTAILLRFFENKSLRDVGAALGTSDDAAQKRVTRALDHLRTFFVRRGIPITSAALTTDLSAAALLTAPAGLGSAIAATTSAALAAAAGAGTATANTVVMTTLQKSLVAGALALTAGVGFFEAHTLYHQRAEIARFETHSRQLDAALARTRTAHAALAARLTATEKDIDSRLAQARAAASSSSADAALEAQLRAWLDGVNRIKSFLAAQPELATPELRLLSADDWTEIATAAAGSLDSEAALARAAALARKRAQNIFAPQLQSALLAYLKSSGDVLPDSLVRLLPFFAEPIAPELLSGYELLHTGKISDLSEMVRGNTLIASRSVIDRELDFVIRIGTAGWTSYSANSPRAFPQSSRANSSHAAPPPRAKSP